MGTKWFWKHNYTIIKISIVNKSSHLLRGSMVWPIEEPLRYLKAKFQCKTLQISYFIIFSTFLLKYLFFFNSHIYWTHFLSNEFYHLQLLKNFLGTKSVMCMSLLCLYWTVGLYFIWPYYIAVYVLHILKHIFTTVKKIWNFGP